jgi:hypothetical protein
MESMPQSPTRARPQSRDTGFPAPFCGSGNTTLPHPEADTSPNATITAEDISVSKVLVRSRRSLLAKNNRRTLSHGIITASMERLHSNADLDDSADAAAAGLDRQQSLMGRPSKDGGESLDRTDTSATGDDESLSSPTVFVNGTAPVPALDVRKPDVEKRRSVLRKLRLT